MKLFFIIFFIIFCQCNSTSLVEIISDKFKECMKYVVNSFKPLQTKIKNVLFAKMKSTEDLDAGNEKKFEIEKCSNHVINVESKNDDRTSKRKISKEKNKSERAILVSVPQLIILHGKRVESHVVLTEDGYFITLHRLKYIINETKTNNVVIFHHGLLGSSADWILLGPEKSLPYLLLNEGYDVWLTNARGNYYSRDHISLQNHSRYWNFSWQEMGEYDLPAVIDYIIQVTNTKENLTYIGHSMGTTVFMTMLSSFPEYNEKFRIAIFLAPLVFMPNAKGPLHALSSINLNLSEDLLNIIGTGEFIPSKKLPLSLAKKYCRGSEIYCVNPLLFLTGSIAENISRNESLIASILYHVPAGGSTNTVLHYAQMVKSGKFQLFGNQKEEISLENIYVPIVLFSSTDDIIATVSDILKLFSNLVCPIDYYTIRGKNITHMDFLWNPNADILIFAKIIEYLQRETKCYTPEENEV